MKIGGQRIPGKTLVLAISESILVGACLMVATVIRYGNLGSLHDQLIIPGAMLRYGLVVVVSALSLYYYDLYDLQIVRRRTQLFVRLLQALGSACVVLAIIYYTDPDLGLGRGVAVISAPLIISLVIGWRLVVDAALPFLRRRRRVLIVGDGQAGQLLARELLNRSELNVDVVGFLTDNPDHLPFEDVRFPTRAQEREASAEQSRFVYTFRHDEVLPQRGSFVNLAFATATAPAAPYAGAMSGAAAVAEAKVEWQAIDSQSSVEELPAVLGTAKEVAKIAETERVDLVVVSLSERRRNMPLRELLQIKFQGIQIEEAHNLFERATGRIMLDHLAPSWLIFSGGFRKPQWLLAVKRLIDIVISAIAIVLAAPFMLLVGTAIAVETGMPMLFRQKRVGLHNKEFQILKFRSMRNEPLAKSASWTSDQDPRITRVGKWIRKFRLDELPQLINVLRGEMSLVGPRPEQPSLARMLEDQIPYYGQRHTLRPGITGWAQVKYGYGATVQETKTKLEHDLFYIKHLSLPLDMAIIFETGKVLLSGRGAK